jgi:hypothetical protein
VLWEHGFLFLHSEVFGAKTNDVRGELQNEEFCNFGKVAEKLRWARHLTRID